MARAIKSPSLKCRRLAYHPVVLFQDPEQPKNMLTALDENEINIHLPIPAKLPSFLAPNSIGSGAPIANTLDKYGIDHSSISSTEVIENLVRIIQYQDSKLQVLERRIADLSFDSSNSKLLDHQKTPSFVQHEQGAVKTPANAGKSSNNEEILDSTPPSVRKLFPQRIGDRGQAPSILQPSYNELENTILDLNDKVDELQANASGLKKEFREAKSKYRAQIGVLSDLLESRNQRIKALASCDAGNRIKTAKTIATQTQDFVNSETNQAQTPQNPSASMHDWNVLLKKVEDTKIHRRTVSSASSIDSNSLCATTETTSSTMRTPESSVSRGSADQRLHSLMHERSLQFRKFMDAKRIVCFIVARICFDQN